ncbi:MAG: hypothetical protein ACYC6C_11140, partial [Coriobacteriia bacterium]
ISNAFRFEHATTEFVSLDRLRYFNAWAFDIVVVPSLCDTPRLKYEYRWLDGFVSNGGVLVCLHSRSGSQHQFLNCATILGAKVERIRVDKSSQAKDILGVEDARSLMLHNDWYAHASFVTKNACVVEPLIYAITSAGDDEGFTTAIIHPPRGSGVVLLSTIDFDFHCLYAPAIPPSRDDEGHIERVKGLAAEVCANMSEWAQEQYDAWSPWRKMWRVVAGWGSWHYLWRDFLLLASAAVIYAAVVLGTTYIKGTKVDMVTVVGWSISALTVSMAWFESRSRIRK